MARHPLLLTVATLSFLLIDKSLASPKPQFRYELYPLPYSYYQQSGPGSNFQPAPFLFNTNLHSPYYHPFFNHHHHLMEEIDHGWQSIFGNNEEEESLLSKTWLKPCPLPRILLPCNCFRSRTPGALPAGNIVCPFMTAAQSLAVFSRVPAGLNIKSVTVTLPRGTSIGNSLGQFFLANYPQATVTIVSPKDTSCIDSTLLAPCTCTGGTITCGAGNTLAQIQTVFNNIAPNTNLGNVVINLPPGVSTIPANFFGKNPANTITLIGGFARALLQLTIDQNAFTASAPTCTAFTIQLFDVENLDYSFLNSFNALTQLLHIQCTNTPVSGNPPKNLPTLQNLKLILVDGIPYTSVCPSALVVPCTCTVTPGDVVFTVTCPAGLGNGKIQNLFNSLPTNLNIGNVILNLNSDETAIPANLLGNKAASTITLIGPTGNPLSKLTIDKSAFTKSADRDTLFTIQQFDLLNLDYSFLTGFNVLTTLALNKCTNTPFASNPPTNLPTFPKPISILVDGVIYTAACPTSALLAPCKCFVAPGDQVCTITCPVGTTIADTQKAFNNLPKNSIIGNIIINLPITTNVPANILGNNVASTIKLICPAGNPLSKLTIDANAFSSSKQANRLFTIEQCDVGDVNYRFLENFVVLTRLLINQCTNSPTTANPPKNLPNFKQPVSVLVNGVLYDKQCPDGALLNPCTCAVVPGDQMSTITCPPGVNMLDIVNAFTRLPVKSLLGNVILNLPTATTTYVPQKVLSNYPATTITLIGPEGTSQLLTIHPGAFSSSTTSATKLTIKQFDLNNLDFSFLNDFNALTSIDIRQCTNSPSDTKPPPLFPILRSLTSFLVDGVKWKWYAQCPAPAIIDPCTCVVVPGDDVCSITCPPGSDIVNIQNVFTAMLKNSILGDVTINFPPDTNTVIPSMLLASNPARTINLIGPDGTPPILTVDPNAFTPSSGTNTRFTIQKFNLINVDYSFLNNFNVLTEIDVNQCTNAPSADNPPNKLPKLPKLTKFSVNGNNIYTP